VFRAAIKEAGEKRKREKDELEEKRMREKEERKLEEQLARAKRERKLAEAKRERPEQNATVGTNATDHNSAKIESKDIALPATKSYAAFLSHKKMHSIHADSSETIAIRLKVFCFWLLDNCRGCQS
jgi:hypothetical protein